MAEFPHQMIAADGPVCGCGKPSRHESGWCGECVRAPAAVTQRPLRHHCIVRSDLPLRQKLVQMGHAAGESAVLGTPPTNTTIFVALEGTLAEIEAVLPALDQRGFRYVRVVEDEGPFAGQLTAIGIEPMDNNRLRKLLYDFRQALEP